MIMITILKSLNNKYILLDIIWCKHRVVISPVTKEQLATKSVTLWHINNMLKSKLLPLLGKSKLTHN